MSVNVEEPYLKSPEHVALPGSAHALETRRFQGIPSLAIAPEDWLWATWYAGATAGENRHNYVVVADSGDRGGTWRERRIVDPDGPGGRACVRSAGLALARRTALAVLGAGVR